MKKVIGIFLICILAFCAFGFVSFAEDETPEPVKTGDIIEFGSYPQTRAADITVNAPSPFNSNKMFFFKGTGTYADGKMALDDKTGVYYQDLFKDGVKYRSVLTWTPRLEQTCLNYPSTSANCPMLENGYQTSHNYLFRFEPIKWLVLDAEKGLVTPVNLLDAEAFNNYMLYSEETGVYYGDAQKTFAANNYTESSLRKWLNEDFYFTAFTDEQRQNVAETVIDEAGTTDKFALYSISAGYTDMLRVCGTDYAAFRGLRVDADGYADWWTGDAQTATNLAGIVAFNGLPSPESGESVQTNKSTDYTGVGVRPVCTFKNLVNDARQYDGACCHEHTRLDNYVAPTCTSAGYSGERICEDCGETLVPGEALAPLGHNFYAVYTKETQSSIRLWFFCKRCNYQQYNYGRVLAAPATLAEEPTCAKAGKHHYCVKTTDPAGDPFVIEWDEPIGKLPHQPDNVVVVKEPTCTVAGRGQRVCSVCNASIRYESIPATGHSYEVVSEQKATLKKNGIKTLKCTVCGDTVTKTPRIKPAGSQFHKASSYITARCKNRSSRFRTAREKRFQPRIIP